MLIHLGFASGPLELFERKVRTENSPGWQDSAGMDTNPDYCFSKKSELDI